MRYLSSRSRRIAATLLLPAALFLTSACGSSSSSERDSGVQRTTPTTPTPTPTTQTPAGTQTPTATGQPGVRRTPSLLSPEDEFRRGLRAMGSGDWSRAEDRFSLLSADPDYGAAALYNLGVIDQAQGEISDAQAHYEDALRADASLAPALTALIRIHLANDDVDGAQLALQRALSQSQNAPAIRASGLMIQLHVGNYEAVIRDARNILIQDESNIDAHLALAAAYHGLHQSELAKLVLDEAVDRAPHRADLWLLRANIQIDQESEVAAIQSLREALDIDPNFVEAHNNLGVLLHRARNEREAIRHFNTALELRPDFGETYLNLSNALKADGQLEEAERSARRALLVDPGLSQAYLTLGLLYLDTEFPGMSRLERFEAAVDHLNRYRSAMGASLPRDDPSQEYLAEAIAALEAEQSLGSDSGGFGDDDFGDEGDDFGDEGDDFGDDEEWEDEEWEDEEWE